MIIEEEYKFGISFVKHEELGEREKRRKAINATQKKPVEEDGARRGRRATSCCSDSRK